MTNQFPARDIVLTAGRDYNSYTRYQYCIVVEERDEPLEIKGGFKTNAQAKKAGIAAAQKFIAPELF